MVGCRMKQEKNGSGSMVARPLGKLLLAACGLCLYLGGTTVASAGGASLLTPGYQATLESWLGEGRLALTNIYSKAAGDTSADFHKASDGKGRTFSVMEATNAQGQTWLIGGYNPQSWNSSENFHQTPGDAERTGFLFNLTSGALHRQMLSVENSESTGSYQTYNAANTGPTFGLGHDLYVPEDLTHNGYSWLYSYSADPTQPQQRLSLLDGSVYVTPDITYGAIQIFTISAVPEPATYGLLLAGLGVLVVVRRGRRPASLA